MRLMPTARDPADSVITVGAGRGFVVSARLTQLFRNQSNEWRSLRRQQSFVITAAHCLPFLPPPHGASYAEERTYWELLGPLGETPAVWAECLFADPVADIAALEANGLSETSCQSQPAMPPKQDGC